MNLKFSELGSTFFTISNLFPVRQIRSGNTKFTMHNPRHTDALLLFSGCTGICYQPGVSPLYIPQGALVYMPKNSRYMWEDTPTQPNGFYEKLLFEFTLNAAEISRQNNEKRDYCVSPFGERIAFSERVEIVTTGHKELYEGLFSQLIASFNSTGASVLEVYCCAYEIFKVVSKDCGSRENISGLDTISKGIRYIEEFPFAETSIKEIADMCGVCVGYFEKIFKKYAGTSPSEYRSARRIFYIKRLLQNHRLTLDEIAEKLNYCDSGYLCRIFKKKTDMTPREYRNLYFSQEFPQKEKDEPELVLKN